MIFEIEKVIGWQNDRGEFLCCKHFDEECGNDGDTAGWSPIEDDGGHIYICDDCHHRI